MNSSKRLAVDSNVGNPMISSSQLPMITGKFKHGERYGICKSWPLWHESLSTLPGYDDLWQHQVAPLGAGGRSQPTLYSPGVGSGDQLLRYGGYLFQRRERGNSRPRLA